MKYNEIQPGVFENTSEITEPNNEQFINSFEQSLLNDKIHYNRLVDLCFARMNEMTYLYYDIVSIGGGLPKFESIIIEPDKIMIVDKEANFYKKQLKRFLDLYQLERKPNIEFTKQEVKPAKIYPYDCICFINFLQYLTWQEIKDWISLQDKDIIIYGPEIATYNGPGWKYENENFKTLFTIDAVSKFASTFGFRTESLTYTENSLIWLRRKK